VLPIVGALSDRVGRKPVWLVSLIGLTVLAIPLYMLMGTGFGDAAGALAVAGTSLPLTSIHPFGAAEAGEPEEFERDAPP